MEKLLLVCQFAVACLLGLPSHYQVLLLLHVTKASDDEKNYKEEEFFPLP